MRTCSLQLVKVVGTRISSAYELLAKLIKDGYPVDDWNIYVFQFSDGDNWGDDSMRTTEIIKNDILPVANQIAYGQVRSAWGSGEFMRDMKDLIGGLDEKEAKKIVTSDIPDRDGILPSIKDFLGRGN